MSDIRQNFREMVADVRAKREMLSSGSHIRSALHDALLTDVARQIEESDEKDLLYGYWPPVIVFVDMLSEGALRQFEAELQLVIDKSNPKNAKDLTQFLKSRARDKSGPWYGGLFDIWAKATAFNSGSSVEFDHVFPNGRDHDILLTINSRALHVENTVITQDDESREVWDRFLEIKKVAPDKVLVRPGAYCPVNAKGPSPYYDALRLYAKLYDKLAKDLNPAKSQCSTTEPNIILVSFAGPGVSATSPSVGWVLDELLSAQPRMVRTVTPESFTDISLDAWIDFTANQLICSGKMTVDFC